MTEQKSLCAQLLLDTGSALTLVYKSIPEDCAEREDLINTLLAVWNGAQDVSSMVKEWHQVQGAILKGLSKVDLTSSGSEQS